VSTTFCIEYKETTMTIKDLTVSYNTIKEVQRNKKARWRITIDLSPKVEGRYCLITPFRLPFVHYNLYCDNPDVTMECIDIKGHSVNFMIRNRTEERKHMILCMTARETETGPNDICTMVKSDADEQMIHAVTTDTKE